MRRLEALEPSAILDVHLGPRNTRYYQEVCGVWCVVWQIWFLVDGLFPVYLLPVCDFVAHPPHCQHRRYMISFCVNTTEEEHRATLPANTRLNIFSE